MNTSRHSAHSATSSGSGETASDRHSRRGREAAGIGSRWPRFRSDHTPRVVPAQAADRVQAGTARTECYDRRLRRPAHGAYSTSTRCSNAMLDTAPGISDLNLSVGRPPQVEIDGALRPVSYAGLSRLLPYHTELIALRLLQGKRDLAEKLLRTGSTDLSYSLAKRTRFRVNVFSQRGSYSVVLRVIPNKIPTVAELGLPQQLNEIANERNGIVLADGAHRAPASPPPWPRSSTR